jgi:hypothetical protein
VESFSSSGMPSHTPRVAKNCALLNRFSRVSKDTPCRGIRRRQQSLRRWTKSTRKHNS